MRPHVLPVPLEPLPCPPTALFCSPEPQLTAIMHRVGVGVALGTQVDRVVTYRGSPDGVPNLHRFHKKVSKTVKKGVPPFWTTFREDFTLPGTPQVRLGPRRSFWAQGVETPGPKTTLRGEFLRCGVLVR